MAGLPDWERGTPGVLCAAGPHPIPISTAARAGEDPRSLLDGPRWRWLEAGMGEVEHAIVAELGRPAEATAT